MSAPIDKTRIWLRLGTLLLAAVLGFLVNVLIQEKYYWTATIPAALLLAIGICEFFSFPKPRPILKNDNTLNDWIVKQVITEQTVSTVKARLNQLVGKLNFDRADHVQMTVHIATRSFHGQAMHSDWVLLQILDYVGSEPTRGKNRIVSAHKGIIGRTFRTSRPHVVNFSDEDDYYSRMTQEFGFFPNEAAYHSTAARSYYSIPFGMDSGDFPIGILYAYSTTSNYFTETDISEDYQLALIDIGTALAADKSLSRSRSSGK